MRFVLAGYGSRGDVEPLAALARELLHRGHDVCMAVPPNMLGFVESAGLAAVAFGSDPQEPGGGDVAANTNIQNPIGVATELLQHIAEACADWARRCWSWRTGPTCY